jgi:hypothetical protein
VVNKPSSPVFLPYAPGSSSRTCLCCLLSVIILSCSDLPIKVKRRR